MSAFTNVCALVGFITIAVAVYALAWWLHASFGGWAVAAYIAAIVIGVTWWCEKRSPFMRRKKPNRWEDLDMPEYED